MLIFWALPCIILKTVREVIRISYVRNESWWLSVAILLALILSWTYVSIISLSASVLFHLVCNLQVIHLNDYGKLLERESDVFVYIEEHIRLRYYLSKISHRFRIYLLLEFLVVTASQFLTLLQTTGYSGTITLINGGDFAVSFLHFPHIKILYANWHLQFLSSHIKIFYVNWHLRFLSSHWISSIFSHFVVCFLLEFSCYIHSSFNFHCIFSLSTFQVSTIVQVVGIILCLHAATKISHRAQAITSLASRWHALVTCGSADSSQHRVSNNVGNMEPENFLNNIDINYSESDLESLDYVAIPTNSQLASYMSSYHKREAFGMKFTYLVSILHLIPVSVDFLLISQRSRNHT